MDLITPSIGLVFWTATVFVILLFLLRKFAWKPILGAVKEREQSISDSLDAAKKAQEELKNLQASNEALLKEARAERENILNEARATKDKIVAEAKGEAQVKADELLEKAHAAIQAEKTAALAEIKTQVAELSIEVASKIVKTHLESSDNQQKLVDTLVEEVSVN